MGYIYILRDTASYRNDFFYPHGGLFTLVTAGSLSFSLVLPGSSCRVLLCLASCAFRVCVLRVWSCDRVVLVVPYRVACLPSVLPLLTPRDRVVWSCGLVMCSGRVSPGVRQVHGLVVIILPYNTKH